MWLSFYNKKGIGDTLLLTSGTASRYDVEYEKKGNVTQVFVRESKEVLGYNIEKISEVISFEEVGQQILTPEQQEVVKGLIEKAGFDVSTLDLTPEDALVVGYVESCVDHEDSDHLHVTMTRVSDSEVLQIVCGAPNVKAGQKVVVAKPGTVMPSGAIIWAGELRGVASHGMLCSARELGLENAPAKKGILVLDDATPVGTSFKSLNLQ